MKQGRAWGIERVVLHGASEDGALTAAADAVIHKVESEGTALNAAGASVVVPLCDERWHLWMGALLAARPRRVVFTYPFPPGPLLPLPSLFSTLPRVILALTEAGVEAGLKGLPACVVPGLSPDWVWRTQNRFYVDADHQGEQALLFFPDIVRWAKSDVCRYCPHDLRCDGVAEPWLSQLGPLGWPV